MRRYVPPVLLCAKCRRAIKGETRMVGNVLYHPVCAPTGSRR